MMEVRQVLPMAASDDPVTRHALQIAEAVREMGSASLFALDDGGSRLEGVLPLEAFPPSGDGATLVLHTRAVNRPLISFVRSRPEPLVLFHNGISFCGPPQLRPVPSHTVLSELGSRSVFGVADSDIHAEQLLASGVASVSRLAPIFDRMRLMSSDPDPGVAAGLEDVDGPAVLCVDSLSQPSRIDDVVAAYHVLSTYLEPDAHLIVAASPGASGPIGYPVAIRKFAEELNLWRLRFLDSPTPAQVAACCAKSAAVVTLADEEEFPVQAIEASSFDIPVVARRGFERERSFQGGAVLLAPGDGIAVAAEAVAALVSGAEVVSPPNDKAERADESRRRLLDALQDLSAESLS